MYMLLDGCMAYLVEGLGRCQTVLNSLRLNGCEGLVEPGSRLQREAWVVARVAADKADAEVFSLD